MLFALCLASSRSTSRSPKWRRRRAAAAAAAAEPTVNKGDTAWMLSATVLVLLMTIPGLALFYGGLVRTKNMLSVLMWVFYSVCIVTILWVLSATAWPSPAARRRSSAASPRRSSRA